MIIGSGGNSLVSPLRSGFSLPQRDLGDLLETLGAKLFVRERTLSQYVSWSVSTGLVRFVQRHGSCTVGQIIEGTELTEAGADSLLGVMCALGLMAREASGSYSLNPAARDYLLEESPYYIAGELEASGLPMPRPYLRGRSGLLTELWLRMLSWSPSIRYGSMVRLKNQHARNLGACAVAARTGEFSGVETMLDLAGGSGAFSIPLALENPRVRIVLAELPEALPGIRRMIAAHGLEDRITLLGLDALRRPWRIPEFDGIFIGNFLHGFPDGTCVEILKEAFLHLTEGGHVWVHEMLWRESRDGPLITALYHAAMRSGGPGRQRAGSEHAHLLSSAGFSGIRVINTSGAYGLVTGRKAGA